MIIKNQLIQDKSIQDKPQQLENKPEQEIELPPSIDALKIEFMQGPWGTVKEFKEFKNILIDDFDINEDMEEWEEEKKELIENNLKVALGEAVPFSPQEIDLSKRRQAEDARRLQRKGLKALDGLAPRTAEEARRMIVSGLEQERAALGISERGGRPSSLTQVNVSLPKTKFDKIINEADFAGILKLIAEIKRERARRIGDIAFGSGKAAVK